MAFLEMFVGPVLTSNKEAYQTYAAQMGELTMKAGALSVTACWGVDGGQTMIAPLAASLKITEEETIVARIVRWSSKAARDEGWAEMMKTPDPRFATLQMPFDRARVCYAAFEEIDA
jgi:uncharacterized protein YbaA (DUF1428 family)